MFKKAHLHRWVFVLSVFSFFVIIVASSWGFICMHLHSVKSLKSNTVKRRYDEMPRMENFDSSYMTSNKPRIVISLTTSPKRISDINTTIQSLINQDMTPDMIQINLPHTFKRTQQDYPQTLLDSLSFLRHPLVKIHRCEDYGPATKLIPTVMTESGYNNNTLIIVVDDDTVYPLELTNIFVRLHLSHPHRVIAGNCGDDYLTNANTSLPAGGCNMFEGFAGVGYPSALFGDDFLSYISRVISDSNCLRSDDYTISNYFARRGVFGITARHMLPAVSQLALGMGKDSLHELAWAEANHDVTYGNCERFLRSINLAVLKVTSLT